MFKKIIDVYKVSEPIPAKASTPEENERKLKRLQWATFLSATIGYGTYYVCRLSLNVIKKPIVDNGVFSETELGIIGSVLFFTYAIGKFTNGFLADRSNIQHAGLLLLCRVDRLLGRRFPVRRTFQRTCQSRTRHGRMRWFVYDVDTRAGRFYRNPRRSGGGRHCLSTGDVRAGSGLCVCRRVGRNASGRLLERIRRSVR